MARGQLGTLKKMFAFEVWCYRRILKIRRVDRMTNEEFFRRVGEERNFLKSLRQEELN